MDRYRKTAILVCLLIIIVFWGVACGYRFSGGGSFPKGIESICILVFENRSFETGLENTVTNDLIREISVIGNIHLTDKKRADAALSGVLSMNTEILSRRGNTPIEKRVRVTADLKLESSKNEVIWTASGVSAQEAYAVTGSDQETEQNKNEAVAVLSKRLAEEIHRRLTDDF